MKRGKFYKQRGFWPFVTLWVGAFFAIYMYLSFIWILANFFLDFGLKPISFYIHNLVVFFVLSLFGIGLAGAFPKIRLTDNGIEYQYLWIFGGFIFWEEAVWIYSSNNQEILGVLINRRGFSRFTPKGLYFNQFYGRFVGVFGKPCLLLSQNMDDFDQIIREIKLHVKPSRIGFQSN